MELIILIKIASLYVFLLLGCVSGETDPGDVAVLEEFRRGLSNPELLKWPAAGGGDADPCGSKWPHVFCSGSRVSQIQVQGLGLSGTLPKDFNKLAMLSNIGLQRNNFSGPLPTFNGLSNLQFVFLGFNQFEEIPFDFFVGLDSLQVLSLDHNPLNQSSGGWTLPPDLANSAQLTNLTLTSCNLVGPLPAFLGKMHSLSVLSLSYNNLSGEIPASYANLPLQILWLNNQIGTGLSGTLDVIASMSSLSDVWLHGNQFSGQIPNSIGALTALTRMWINNNQLVGFVPGNLIDLPQLQDLKLDNNFFMGPIPEVSYNFTYSSNSFCQSKPGLHCSSEVSALSEFLAGLGFPIRLAKSWIGNDPCSFWLGVACYSGNVTVINVPKLGLNGTISPSLAQLSSLTRVLLGDNHIGGPIPSDLTQLNSLKVLDLSDNNISPPVPSFSKSVKLLLAGNNMLDNPSAPSSSPSGDTPPSGNPPNSPAGSPPSSSSNNNSNGSKKLNIVFVIVPVILGIFIVAALLLLLYWRGKRRNIRYPAQNSVVILPRDPSDPENLVKVVVANRANNSTPFSEQSSDSNSTNGTHVIESGNLVISVQVLRNATQNFASYNVIGHGGFGVVYQGKLQDGTMVAVKRMESAVLSSNGFDEFQAEIDVLSKVRHRNLVSILGYSIEDNERLLVYEYMSRGALSRHLFQWKQFELEPLSWKKRLNIALDVARGMEYLHSLAHQSFIHRDLKPANILLGDDFRSKVSDFGLVKLAPEGNKSIATKLAGTFGYLAPEYAVTGKVSTKVDVFSYGVVLMELVTGLVALDENRPEESRYLASWFINMKNSKEKLKSIIDPSISITGETLESISIIAELAGHCVAREPNQRPDMGHAVNVLAPLVEKWKPFSDDQDECMGIDLCRPLLQMVIGWEENDGSTFTSSMNLDNSKGSIPPGPAGFSEPILSIHARIPLQWISTKLECRSSPISFLVLRRNKSLGFTTPTVHPNMVK